jgi:PAS domain S-box-containing protein
VTTPPARSTLSAAECWEVSFAVTQILAEPRALPTAISDTLYLLAHKLQYDAAGFWIVDEAKLLLTCAGFWTASDERYKDFEKVSRARHFSIGEGLPGTVWVNREVFWIKDLTAAKVNFPRASVARVEGLRSGVGFPAYVGKRVIGVFEFFTSTAYEPGKELVDFLLGLGGQIGIFLDHRRATEALTQSEAQFRIMAESACDALFTIDQESTILYCNAAVERIFGYAPSELVGRKLTIVMPEYLRHVHEHSLRRYIQSGEKHIPWENVPLPGLHKDGREIPLLLSFGEFLRGQKRVFTGFARERKPASQHQDEVSTGGFLRKDPNRN